MKKQLLSLWILWMVAGSLFSKNFCLITDTSESNLDKTVDVYEYYFFQNSRTNLTDAQKLKYRKKIKTVERKILDIHTHRSTIPIDSGEIMRTIIVLLPESKPVYAHEPKSTTINIGTSYFGGSYFPPILLSAENGIFSEKITIGPYLGFFSEIRNLSSGDENASFLYSNQIYRYNYLGVGIKGSYHLLNIEPLNAILNPKIMDLYASGMLGVNLAYIKDHLPNAIFPPQPPTKEGVNVGIMLGVRFFPEDHLNFFAEAGYSRIGYLSIGLGYRILRSPRKADE